MTRPEDVAARLVGEFGLRPVVGLEIEWYIRPEGHLASYAPAAQERDGYLDALNVAADASRLDVDAFERERGPGQFEASLHHTADLERLLRQMTGLVEAIQVTGCRCGYVTDFAAKPYCAAYGSGLHVHIHLENSEGANVFRKEEKALSPELEAALAGALADLPRALKAFAPRRESLLRFEPGWHAPVKACWGTNNRTVALRLPDGASQTVGQEALAKLKNSSTRRIEHRVAGSDADAGAVVTAVLEGILLGLRENPPLSAPVFGDAGHAQYDHPPILGMVS